MLDSPSWGPQTQLGIGDELTHLRSVAEDPSIGSALEAVRDFLCMDVAYTRK